MTPATTPAVRDEPGANGGGDNRLTLRTDCRHERVVTRGYRPLKPLGNRGSGPGREGGEWARLRGRRGMCHVLLLLFMGNAISRRKTTESVTGDGPPKTSGAIMDELTRDVERLKAAVDEKHRMIEQLGRTVEDVRVSRRPLLFNARNRRSPGVVLALVFRIRA